MRILLVLVVALSGCGPEPKCEAPDAGVDAGVYVPAIDRPMK